MQESACTRREHQALGTLGACPPELLLWPCLSLCVPPFSGSSIQPAFHRPRIGSSVTIPRARRVGQIFNPRGWEPSHVIQQDGGGPISPSPFSLPSRPLPFHHLGGAGRLSSSVTCPCTSRPPPLKAHAQAAGTARQTLPEEGVPSR